MRTGVRDIILITTNHSNEMGYWNAGIFEKIYTIKWGRSKGNVRALFI